MDQFIWALGISMHFGLGGNYNEIHPHVRFIEDGVIAGAYYNSVENISFYSGYRLEYEKFGAELALVTGYPAYGAVAPFIRGTYDVTDNVLVFASPAIEDYEYKGAIGIVAGIEFKF